MNSLRAFSLFGRLLAGAAAVCAGLCAAGAHSAMWNPLTPEERHILEERGTERPFSGLYDAFFEDGLYLCKRCQSALYRSADKFDSGCGWPAFDAEIPGAVRRLPDADGLRTEIRCAECGGHLGHVFEGENRTPKNTRHCVNSLSLSFVPSADIGRVVVAGGCFWGVEALLRGQEGVWGAVSGYAGPQTQTPPDYARVCTGKSGYLEAVEVLFDKRRTSAESLYKCFFEIHDFEQANGQGPDIGPQYRSAVFYLDAAQKRAAETCLQTLRRKGYTPATSLLPFEAFYPAEAYHQRHYARTGETPYCHARKKIF